MSQIIEEKLVASEVYTHLNCSIKPHETSSNAEKLSPDTLTARSPYTNQMDLGLESIFHHQAAITGPGSACLGTEPCSLLCPQTPWSRAGGHLFPALRLFINAPPKKRGRRSFLLDFKRPLSSSGRETGKVLGKQRPLKKLTGRRLWKESAHVVKDESSAFGFSASGNRRLDPRPWVPRKIWVQIPDHSQPGLHAFHSEPRLLHL